MDYNGKYFKQIDSNTYSALLSDKNINQLHLLLNYCVDLDRVNNTKDTKYFYKELLQEVQDILTGF